MCADKLPLLETEVFKTEHSFNTTLIKEIFVLKNNQHALRNELPIKLLETRTANFRENKRFYS